MLSCFALLDGKPLWWKQYSAPYEMNSTARGHGKGPKSTPAMADGELVMVGITGVLSCWETEIGRRIWRESFEGRFEKRRRSAV